MTLLEINLTDVLSETDPNDRVLVWAPAFREGQAGQLVGPRQKAIPLVDGVGSDEVLPGPLMVQVRCKAMSDTHPREVVVPETGPVTLTDLFDSAGDFTYTPHVVGRVALDAQRAEDAAVRAEDAAVRAEDGTATVQSVNGQSGTVVLGHADVGAAPVSHTHPAADITDATTVGRNVLKAATAAAARTAIGAGTSSLALGTTASTAKAGNYQPTVAGVTGLQSALDAKVAGVGITSIEVVTVMPGTPNPTTFYIVKAS